MVPAAAEPRRGRAAEPARRPPSRRRCRWPRTLLLLLPLALGAACTEARGDGVLSHRGPLRVCADPDNLPFSNARREGFENKLVELLAAELGTGVEYVWWSERPGLLRKTLGERRCDLVAGVPTAADRALVTRPYYRSTYVYVRRSDASPPLGAPDQPGLRRLRIGVQMVGDDPANTPPALALAQRGTVDELHGCTVFGDFRERGPGERIVAEVARGELDVAVVWGPVAGYFGRRQAVPLALAPVTPQVDLPSLPFVLDVGIAVRPDDAELRDWLEIALDARRAEVDRLLAEFAVPRVDATLPEAAETVD